MADSEAKTAEAIVALVCGNAAKIAEIAAHTVSSQVSTLLTVFSRTFFHEFFFTTRATPTRRDQH